MTELTSAKKFEMLAHKYALDFERSLPYFLDQLNDGKVFSKILLKNLDVSSGSFFTWVLDPAEQVSYNFSATKGKGFIGMEGVLYDFLGRFLHENNRRYAFLEDYLSKPGDSAVNIKNVAMSISQEDVYHILSCSNSDEEIVKAVDRVDLAWHCLMFLTEWKQAKVFLNELTDSILKEICSHIQFIVVGAYDGEGYIVWEKNKRSLS